MFTMMKDPNEMAAKQSLNVMIELYRKKVWYCVNNFSNHFNHLNEFLYICRNDAKTVNVISTGIFSGTTSVVVSSLKFFLTVAADDEEDRITAEKEKV